MARFSDAAKSGCSSINVEDEYFQARTSTGEGRMFAAAGDFKIRSSKDAIDFWGRVDTYLRLDATEEQAFQAAIDTIGLTEREEIMEIVTSWEQKAAQKTREEIALNLLKRGMIVQEISQVTGLSLEQVQHLLATLQ